MIRPCLSLLIAVLVCQAGNISAQSLGEIAKREKARRASLHKPKPEPVYTNVGAGRFERTRAEVGTRQPVKPEPQARQRRALMETTQIVEAPKVVPASFTPSAPAPTGETIVLSASAPSRQETLETGYALLASSRHAEAADVFLSILRLNPSDREARLGLGRVYSRSGQHAAGRIEFEKVLVVNPSDAEAMVDIAQSYQWSGVGPMAREWYENALAIDPRLEQAEVGLGYIELWNEPAMAERRSENLETRFPGSANVRALQGEAQKARAPEFHVSFDRLTDSHQNELGTAWVEASLGMSSGWDVWVGGALYDMSFQGAGLVGAPGEGSITSFYGVMGRPVAPGQRVDFRVGVDYRRDTMDSKSYVPIGGAAWSWGLDRKWSGRVSFERDSFRYTTRALDDGIVLNAFSASVTNRIASNWLLDGEVGYWDIDDKLGVNNSRFSTTAGLRYRRLFGGRIPLEAGYNFQYFTYKESFGASFFSPSFYRGHRFDIGVGGPLGSIFDFQARGAAGVQSFDYVSHEPLWTAGGTLGLRLGSGYKLEVYGTRGDFLMLSNFPVTTEQFGLRLRWQGGSTP